MKTLKFYGSSDDLLLLEVNGKLVDEICSIKGPAIYRVSQGEQALLVVGLYSPAPVHNGCWVVGATLLNEGVPLPAWPIQMETGPASGYPDPQPYSPTAPPW